MAIILERQKRMAIPENGFRLNTDEAGYNRRNETMVGWHLSPDGEPLQPINGSKTALIPTKIDVPAPIFYKQAVGLKLKDNLG